MIFKLQIFSVAIGVLLPAFLNIYFVSRSVLSFNPESVGFVFFIFAIFYVVVDLFNLGSSRLYSIFCNKKQVAFLIILDLISGILGALFFLIVLYFLKNNDQYWVINVNLACFALLMFSLSHVPIGSFRYHSKNHFVAICSLISSFLRCLLVEVFIISDYPFHLFFEGLMIVEILYSLSLLFAYLFFFRKDINFNSINNYLFVEDVRSIYHGWSINVVSMLGKHLDIVFVGFLFGNAIVPAYRLFKSFLNLSFNFGSSLGLYFVGSVSLRLLCNFFVKFYFLLIPLIFVLIYFASFVFSHYFGYLNNSLLDQGFVFYCILFCLSLFILINKLMVQYLFLSNSMLVLKIVSFEAMLSFASIYINYLFFSFNGIFVGLLFINVLVFILILFRLRRFVFFNHDK